MRTRTICMLAVVIISLAVVATAGITGKIAGRIQDQQTREPLVGATVIIVGTTYGSSTDVEGRYFILNVPAGTYDVRVAYVGYTSMAISNVRVAPDLTTELNADLSQSTVELQAVTVSAERPLIQKDATSSVSIVEAQTLRSLPINSALEALTLQAGFVVSNNGSALAGDDGIHLRGGRTGEVLYMIDGVAVNDPLFGGLGSDVARLGVASLNVVSGAFNAEYGQAQSGIVNIVTQEGSQQYQGMARFATDRFGVESNDWGTTRMEATLSGPLISGATLFVSGDYLFTRTYLNESTGPLYYSPGGRRIQNEFDFGLFTKRSRANAKLTFTPFQSVKMTVGGVYTATDGKAYTHAFKEYPEFNGFDYTRSLMANANVTHTLSPQTYYELKYSYFRRAYQHYLYEEQKDRNFNRIYAANSNTFAFDSTSNYEFNGWSDFVLLVEDAADQRQPITEYVVRTSSKSLALREEPEAGDVVLAVPGQTLSASLAGDLRTAGIVTIHVLVPPTDDTYQDSKSTTHTISASLTSQINSWNLVKLGAEYKVHEVSDFYIPFVNGAWNHIDPASVQPEYKRHSEISNYTYRPVQIAAYLQDKMEVLDMIINLGLRFDYFDPKAPNTYALMGVDKTGSTTVDPKMRFSPRFGIAFPVTDRAKMHFSYGQFFQYPDFFFLYRRYNQNIPTAFQSTTPYVDVGRGYEPQIGNPNLKPEVTHAYQTGGDYIVSDLLVVGATIFYKDTYDYIATKRSRAGATDFYEIANLDYANTRGFEISLRRRFADNYAFSLNYTFSRAEGNADSWNSHFAEQYLASVSGSVPPKKTVTLAWDQPHTLNFDLTYTRDTWGMSMIGSFGSGLPYTPTDPRGTFVGEVNSGRQPWTGTIDVRLHKAFVVAPTTFTVFANVTNLLNKRNVQNVFQTSGKPDFSMNPNASAEVMHTPTNFGPPRHVEIGVEFSY